MSEIRTRFAPSPTGYLHVGGLRTALFNFLYAKKLNGKVILRIEDTDQSRKVEGAVENLQQSLAWAGIEFDEGVGAGGELGPYTQSERLDIYRKYVDQLLEQGDAYYCFCSSEELTKIREEQKEKKLSIPYDGRCGQLSQAEIDEKLKSGTSYVVRMKIPRDQKSFIINDLIRGKVEFNTEQVDDQIILKSGGFPTYHLASVVDDHLMKITHVIRGEEWLPSTPKHVQLYKALGWEAPQFSHLPLLLNSDRSKLSKRQGDVATEDYKKKGFLNSALINFVALLGWNTSDDNEIFSMEELIENFSLERVSKGGAVFDTDKLRWMNQQYIKTYTAESLYQLAQEFIPEYAAGADEASLIKMIGVVKDSLVVLTDLEQKLELFFKEDLKIDDALKAQISDENSQAVFKSFIEEVEAEGDLSSENFGKIMKKVQKASGVKGKGLWGSIRIAITLVEHGPDLAGVIDIFGKEKCLKMVKQVLV